MTAVARYTVPARGLWLEQKSCRSFKENQPVLRRAIGLETKPGSGSHSVDISLVRFEVSQLPKCLIECVPQPNTLPRSPTLYIVMILDISDELLYKPKPNQNKKSVRRATRSTTGATRLHIY